MFTDYETVLVRTAKSWDCPRMGAVPILLKTDG